MVNEQLVSSINTSTGLIKWTYEGTNIRVNPSKNLILDHSREYKLLSLIDPLTGERIWRKQSTFKSIENVIFNKDSSVVVIEDGVHHVDLRNGEMNYMVLRGLNKDGSYKKSSGKRAVAVGASAVLFGLVGLLASSAATNSMAIGTSSKSYLIEDEAIYISSQAVTRYDYNNKIVWMTADGYKRSGQSTIISLNDTEILYVDFGSYQRVDGKMGKVGNPFCAVYEKKTGKLVKGFDIPTEAGDYIDNYVMIDNEISFKGQSTIFKVDFSTLKITKKNTFSSVGANSSTGLFLDPQIYLTIDSVFVKLYKYNPQGIYFKNKGSKVIELNADLEMQNVHDDKSFFSPISSSTMFTLVSNGLWNEVIDKNGKRVLKESLSTDSNWVNDEFLIDQRSNKLIIYQFEDVTTDR